MSITLASWNIHRGVGGDGRCKPERIAGVIGELAAGIVALQEFGVRRRDFNMATYLCDAGRCEIVTQTTLHDRHGAFGNAVLTRLPILRSITHDLAVSGREPRGALEVVVATSTGPLRIINTHLGLSPRERRLQAERLIEIVRADAQTPTLLAGDFNVWQRRDDSLRLLRDHLAAAAAPRTFPAWLPVLRLDRIFHDRRVVVAAAHAHRSRAARIASDHLPLLARINIAATRERP